MVEQLMPDILIRKLGSGDARILQACRLAALQESPEAFVATYAEVKHTPVLALEAELDDADIHYVGAFVDGRLVGFARCVRPVRKARRHTAEVRSVFVHTAHRGNHVATRLLAQLIADARAEGLETLTLLVLADNVAARRLYESLGFRPIGTEQRAVKRDHGYVDQVQYWLGLADS